MGGNQHNLSEMLKADDETYDSPVAVLPGEGPLRIAYMYTS